MFGEDQIESACGKRPKEWSPETIVKALKVKLTCGSRGYEHERKTYPLPSQRTLRARLEGIHFDFGLLNDVFSLLQSAVSRMAEDDKDCVIILDEMSIEKDRTYCLNNKKIFGDVTLPSKPGVLAIHALLFLVAGIKLRWKQSVAYH